MVTSNQGLAMSEKRECIARDNVQLFPLHAHSVCLRPVHWYMLALCTCTHAIIIIVSYFCVCLVGNACNLSTHPAPHEFEVTSTHTLHSGGGQSADRGWGGAVDTG